MPKVRASVNDKLNKFVREFGSGIFSTDGEVLFCKICEKSVNSKKKYFITQHIESANHRKFVERKTNVSKTPLLKTFIQLSNRESEFSFDLCRAFVTAGIPLWKLENSTLRACFNKYVKENLPSESTLRKNYLDRAYQQTIREIQRYMMDKKIWISIDETTDATGRHIANVIVGSLEYSTKIYLINSECLERANGSTIAQLFTTSLSLLWPDGVHHDNVLLFVSDAAPYMKKAGNALKVLFPRMIHLTCIVHGVHRIAEEIREHFPDVDKLISSLKKIFLKSPSRRRIFKEIAPELPLPPQSVLTRWGTWLSTACYYSNNLKKKIKEVVLNLDEDSAAAIKIVKILLDKKSVQHDLAFISCNYSFIPDQITILESRNLPLVEAVDTVNTTIKNICSVSGSKGRVIEEKCESVIKANSDFKIIQSIADILSGTTPKENVDYEPNEIAHFKFAPVTSIDVERSFSQLKCILSDRRQVLTTEDLKKIYSN